MTSVAQQAPLPKKSKKRRITIILLIIIVFLSTTGFSYYHFFLRGRSLDINQAPPIENEKATKIKYSDSFLNLSLNIDHKKLATEINKNFKEPIYIKGRINLIKSRLGKFDMDYKFKIILIGDITTSTQGEDLIFHIPVKFDAELRPIGDLFFKHTQKASGEVIITSKVRLGFHENWQPYLKLDLSYNWKDNAYTYILGAKIILSSLIENNLKGIIQGIIDKELAATLNFPKEIGNAWNTLHNPIQVNPDPPLWLLIRPHKVYFPPLSGDEQNLKIRFAVKVSLATLLADNVNKANIKKITPLPALEKTLPSDNDRFYIRLPLLFSYKTIIQEFKKQVVGKEFSINEENSFFKNKLRILDFRMYPSTNDTLCLGVFVDNQTNVFLSTRGWIYFLFRPEFDREKNTIVFSDINFTRQLSNKFLEAGSWVLGDTLLTIIKNQVNIDLNQPFQDALKSVNKEIFNRKIADNIFLKGNLSDLGVDNVDISRDAFLLYTRFAGTLSITVK